MLTCNLDVERVLVLKDSLKKEETLYE